MNVTNLERKKEKAKCKRRKCQDKNQENAVKNKYDKNTMGEFEENVISR